MVKRLASNGGDLDGIQVTAGKSIFQLLPKFISNIDCSLDCYIDARNAPSIIEALPDMIQLKAKGVKLRCITEITGDTLPYSKDLMKYFDLYHLPSLRGAFIIIDGKEYLGSVVNKKGEQLIHIGIRSFVDNQQFIFDKLIENALPARPRILEIRKGGEADFMETVRDPHRIKTLVLNLINSAVYEISIIFSNRSLVFLAEREGILDALGILSKNGIRIRILIMEDDAAKKISRDEFKFAPEIRANYLQQFLPSKITTFIFDESKSLVIEVSDSKKETFQDAIGLATYSNSESTVFSNTSMFESLWIQSEIDKQNRTKQVYFQMFKGFKLKDEIYNRRWSFESDEKHDEGR
jgi:hypothetical protein